MFENDHYSEIVFREQEIKGALKSDIVFDECRFENCQFDTVTFKNTHFERCVFSACELTLPDVSNTIFDDVEFENCKVTGCNFSLINNFNTALKFNRSKLITCSFVRIDLRNTVFAGSVIDDAIFRDCNLTGADFEDVQFRLTEFSMNDLRKTNFKNASGFHLDPCTNKLKGAAFSSLSALELLKPFEIKIL